MPEPIDTRPDFEDILNREVERIVADPGFARSPVQSRLLQYLRDRTLAHNRVIQQAAVAGDGAGRLDSIEHAAERYPRVQISRLRRSLAQYYAGHPPGEGQAVYILHGEHQLRMASPGVAYPERPAPASAGPAANDAPVPHPRAPPPPPPPPTPPGSAVRPWIGAAAVLAIAALAGLWFRGAGALADAAPALAIEVGDEGRGSSNPLVMIAAQQAGDVADTSYVVRKLNGGAPARRPDYVVKLERSQNVGAKPILNVSLFDRANERLFRDVIPIGPDPTSTLTRLNGSMMHIVGPAGVIAQRELSQFSGPPRSDYECVLQTEYDRMLGLFRIEGVTACLDRYPRSDYRAYWLARLAFMAYRGEAAAGRAVQAEGPAWRMLQQAFAADPANPFANYVAAKVNFARGDCSGGAPYLERSLVNGSFHGTMMAAALSDASLCANSGIAPDEAERRVAALVAGIPEPNPLQHVYLIFASAAVDRPDLARRLLATPTSEPAEGALAEEMRTLDEALAGPAQFAASRARLQEVINAFYWGPNARRTLMEKLAALANSRAETSTAADAR